VLDCFVAVPGVGRVLDCLEITDDDWFSEVICWVVYDRNLSNIISFAVVGVMFSTCIVSAICSVGERGLDSSDKHCWLCCCASPDFDKISSQSIFGLRTSSVVFDISERFNFTAGDVWSSWRRSVCGT